MYKQELITGKVCPTCGRDNTEEEICTADDCLGVMMDNQGIGDDMKDACKAYLEVTGADDLSGFEESYTGQYDDDEDFAQQIADDLGAIPKDAAWPMTCIDWEQAARELMYDHSEQDGFYFRKI